MIGFLKDFSQSFCLILMHILKKVWQEIKQKLSEKETKIKILEEWVKFIRE